MTKTNWVKRTVFVLVALAVFACLVKLGLSTIVRFSKPEQDLNLIFDEDSSLMLKFERDINLKGLRASGSFAGDGAARIYIENDGKKYLVFDSNELKDGAEESEADEVEFITQENLVGFATNELADEQSDDENNTEQGIDFSIDYSINKVAPSDDDDVDDFYPGYDIGYITDDAVCEAKGFAESIDVDDEEVSLDQNIIKSLLKKTFPESGTIIDFEDICIETCSIQGFDKHSYKLIFEVEDAVIKVDSIEYSFRRVWEKEEVKPELDVRDSKGKTVDASVIIKDKEGEVIEEEALEKGLYDVEVELEQGPVISIEIKGADLDNDISEFVKVDDVPEEMVRDREFVEVYAIDPTQVDFTEATVTAVAKGRGLYKCKDWNFSEQSCHGEWAKIKDLAPGEEYTFTLTPDDPGYGESALVYACYKNGVSISCSVTDEHINVSDDERGYMKVGDNDFSYVEFRFGSLGIDELKEITSGELTVEYYNSKAAFTNQKIKCYDGSDWIEFADAPVDETEQVKVFNLAEDCYKPASRANDIRVRFGYWPYSNTKGRTYFDFVRVDVESMDVVPPTINDVNIIPSAIDQGQAADITANITDDTIVTEALARIEIPNGDIVESLMAEEEGIWHCTFTTAASSPGGTYDVILRAKDANDNWNEDASTSFIVNDVLNPIIENAFTAGIYDIGSIVGITVNTTDETGIGSVIADITLNSSNEIVELVLQEDNVTYAGYFDSTSELGIYETEVIVKDTSSNENSSIIYFEIMDLSAPEYSTIVTLPSSNVTYAPDRSYHFNVRWEDMYAVDTVLIEHDFTGSLQNYSTNISESVYYYEYVGLGAGSYLWRMYANDSFGNRNEMEFQSFFVRKAAPTCGLSFTAIPPQTYGTAINVSCSCTNPEASAVLYRDEADVTSENDQAVSLGAGNHSYNCVVDGTQNYLSADNSFVYTINKAGSEAAILLNGQDDDITINQTESVIINAGLVEPSAGIIRLYQDDDLIDSGQSPLTTNITYNGVGTFSIEAVYPETGNYSSSSESRSITVRNTLPPPTVTGLDEDEEGYTWVYWSWTNPDDASFDYVEVYLDGMFKENTSNDYYNATGLSQGANYTLSTRTVSIAGKINTSWVNDTASTTADTTPPEIISRTVRPREAVVGESVFITANATDNINVSSMSVNITLPDNSTVIYELPIDYTTSAAGWHNLKIIVSDSSGNTATERDWLNIAEPETPESSEEDLETTETGSEECTPDWDCGNWSECSEGMQTRTCRNTGACSDEHDAPATEQECAVGTCDDGIQNQDELGIDCGGPCSACTECSSDENCDDGHACMENECVESSATAPLPPRLGIPLTGMFLGVPTSPVEVSKAYCAGLIFAAIILLYLYHRVYESREDDIKFNYRVAIASTILLLPIITILLGGYMLSLIVLILEFIGLIVYYFKPIEPSKIKHPDIHALRKHGFAVKTRLKEKEAKEQLEKPAEKPKRRYQVILESIKAFINRAGKAE
ncbi:hypothetical protein KY361_07215, partial [Candidatus Woesearchaeota archaeon]|nr:hypothetical protein [Candidatus Woesearchaeota archaeon]